MTRAAATSALAATGLAPRGLSREQAAAYVGVSERKFDAMVEDGRMPGAKKIDTRLVWDRLALDAAFARLPNAAGGAPESEDDDVWSRAAV